LRRRVFLLLLRWWRRRRWWWCLCRRHVRDLNSTLLYWGSVGHHNWESYATRRDDTGNDVTGSDVARSDASHVAGSDVIFPRFFPIIVVVHNVPLEGIEIRINPQKSE
jgi:hypothetical protein